MYDTPQPFPYEDFLNYFPQLGPESVAANTPEFIVACGDRAGFYLSRYDSVWVSGSRRIYAHCLLAAHILHLTNHEKSALAEGGDLPVGPVTSASVGGVSTSMATPNSSGDGAFEWWLNKTPYGQEFLALVRTRGPMLTFVGSQTPVLPLR